MSTKGGNNYDIKVALSGAHCLEKGHKVLESQLCFGRHIMLGLPKGVATIW